MTNKDDREKLLAEWDETVTAWFKEDLPEDLVKRINSVSKRWYDSTVERVDLCGYISKHPPKKQAREKKKDIKTAKTILNDFIAAGKNKRFEMLFSLENKKRKKYDDFATADELRTKNIGLILDKTFVTTDSYNQLIKYIFEDKLTDDEKQILLDALCMDAALIAMEKLVTPYLEGCNNIKIQNIAYPDNLLLPESGRCKMEVKKSGSVDDIVGEYISIFTGWGIYGDEISNNDSDDENDHIPDEYFWDLVGDVLKYMPEEIFPFVVMSLYVQYKQAVIKGADPTDVIKQMKDDGLEVIPEKNKKRYKLLKDDRLLAEHYNYLYIDQELYDNSCNMLLNIYLHNRYFPITDIILLYNLATQTCTAGREFKNKYESIIEFVNIKPYFTKHFMLANSIRINKDLRFNEQPHNDTNITAIQIINAIADCLADKIIKLKDDYPNEYDSYKNACLPIKTEKRYRYLFEDLNHAFLTWLHTPQEVDESIVQEATDMENRVKNNNELKKIVEKQKKAMPTIEVALQSMCDLHENKKSPKDMSAGEKIVHDKLLRDSELLRTIYEAVRLSKANFSENIKKYEKL